MPPPLLLLVLVVAPQARDPAAGAKPEERTAGFRADGGRGPTQAASGGQQKGEEEARQDPNRDHPPRQRTGVTARAGGGALPVIRDVRENNNV